MRELSREESDRRAAAGEPFVLRFRVPRESREAVTFTDLVYGEQSKATAESKTSRCCAATALPTYHLASCADDADLRISHIIRGQDHLTNTFKHVLIFEALGVQPPQFAHLPLLIAPDGSKLSKRKHGPVVSVTTYRDAGFLPQALRQFPVPAGLVAEGRSRGDVPPGTDRRVLARRRQPLQRDREFHGRRSLRSQGGLAECGAHPRPAGRRIVGAAAALRASRRVRRGRRKDGGHHAADPASASALLREVATAADFFFADELPPYDSAELIPQKGDARMALAVLEKAA